jgi:hypothetical protein
MPTISDHETIDHEEYLVHEWRVTQLKRLGIPGPLAEADADNVDWHQIAKLVRRGCPPRLALRIVRLKSIWPNGRWFHPPGCYFSSGVPTPPVHAPPYSAE